ncbi:MAG: chemotaxis protein CheW [Holophaga sp.]|jgi:purine-binding chemotaxis protein CheW
MTQYSTFYLGDRRFGLPILSVREIIRSCEITPVPLAPPHVRGLINLRGQIVTILDLAVRLDIQDRPDARESHVVVLAGGESALPARERSTDQGGGEDMAGFLVDGIGDVVEADVGQTKPAPANVTEAEGRLLCGVIQADSGLLALLDLQGVLHGN